MATQKKPEELPIPLVDPDRWTARIVDNKDDDQDRVEELIADGWQYLNPDDLAVNSKDIGFKVMNSHVVRGDHGEEVLLKILTVDLAAFEEKDRLRTPTPVEVKAELREAIRAPEPSQVVAAKGHYPATRYSKDGTETVVADAAADKALGPGWHDSPKKAGKSVKAKSAKASKAKTSKAKAKAAKATKAAAPTT
jgi:hypothetical protein